MYVYVVCVCVYFFLMNCCIYAGSLPLNNTHFLRIKYSLIKSQYIYYFQIFNIHIILLIYFPYSNFVNYSKIFFFFFFSQSRRGSSLGSPVMFSCHVSSLLQSGTIPWPFFVFCDVDILGEYSPLKFSKQFLS